MEGILRWLPFSSVRARLLLLVLLSVLPALGVILYTGWEEQRHRVRDTHARALRLARAVAHSHDNLIQDTRRLLLTLSHLPQIRRQEAAPCSTLLSDIAKQYTRYTAMVAATPDGAVFCSSQPLPAALNVADRAYFRRALESRAFAVGDYVFGRVTGKPVLSLTAPSIDESGVVRAVVIVGLDLTWLEDARATFGLPQGSALSVVDGNGVVLARYPDPEKWVGRSVKDTPPAIARLTQQDAGTAEAQGLDGTPRLYGWVRLEGASGSGPLYVRVGIARDLAFAEHKRTLGRNLAALGLAAILMLAVAWAATNRLIVRPVRVLADVAGRLGAGDSGVRSGLSHEKSEFGRLAAAFDGMAEALREREAEVARAQEALREAHDYLDKLIQHANAPIIVWDPALRITRFNGAFERLTGYGAQEVLGRELSLLFPEASRGESLRNITSALGGEFWEWVEIPILRKDGATRLALWNSANVYAEDGTTVTATIAQGVDITERRRAEEQLRQSEKLAALGELLAGVAHELNNPLSVVLGQALLLRQSAAAGPAEARAAKILQAAERCARIVRNFLALARQYPPERQQMGLNPAVTDVLELLAYQLRVDNVEVKLDLTPDLPGLWADPHQLHQVLVNLITNAQHAMRETPPPRRLTLRTSHEPREHVVCLEATDTGPGIPPEVQTRIFDPFFTTKPPGQGTGLGLSLSRGIVEGHGGTIAVESRSGQGATFRVRLPVIAAPVAEKEKEGRAPEAAAPVRGEAILVVDDEPEIAALLADILAAGGQEVETAANGALALDKLGKRAYGAILSDIKMPELDGPGLYRELERHHPDLVRRVIFLTGDTLAPGTAEFLDRTGAPVLTKPFRVEEVIRVVQRVLQMGTR